MNVQILLKRFGHCFVAFVCMAGSGITVAQLKDEHLIPPVKADSQAGYYQSTGDRAGGTQNIQMSATRLVSQAGFMDTDGSTSQQQNQHSSAKYSAAIPLTSNYLRLAKSPVDANALDTTIYYQEPVDVPPIPSLAQSTLTDRQVDGRWTRKSIQELRVDIRETASVAPRDRSSELNYGFGDWNHFHCEPKLYAWCAPDIRYQPLYFEDVALERYGQTMGFHRQTLRSAGHFFKSGLFLPNQMRHDPPCSCDYPLGFCRPGSATGLIQQRHYLGRPF